MNAAVAVIRIIVGVLFLLSGLVKANDPLGLSYKMQEFFEIWNADLLASHFFLKDALVTFFSFLHRYSLTLSVVMITLEIVAGVALLLGCKKRWVLNLLLPLILFFTFLTAYAYGSGKFKNCGCFGDCLPISPLQSLLKDFVLLIFILFLFYNRKYITPLFSSRISAAALLGALLFSLGVQWFVLTYLPLADCLPFKKGNSIEEKMKIPANAITDSFAIRFVYKKEGKEFEFSPESLPADLGTYTFVKRTDKLVRKGNAEPPIKGFSLTGLSGVDSTEAVLRLPRCILLFTEHFANNPERWIAEFRLLVAEAQKRTIPVYLVTTTVTDAVNFLNTYKVTGIPVFSCDNTAVRTAARTNPTALLLQKGTVQQKYSYRQLATLAKAL